eukprot:TRINITY_DN47651_c0_g1_i1.p1 TRINITY_DN47651_c0_g1~~TRINITY_DN47651_c0_g1_i1.p1  ORF type:complete len:728 (+),score=138.14 TRINITY_DN47651_c0_g1_i1:104-2185(+)
MYKEKKVQGEPNSHWADDPAKNPSGGGVVWYWKELEELRDTDADAWCAYSSGDSKVLEAAFERGKKTVDLGNYIVHLDEMIQKHKQHQSRQRRVIRAVRRLNSPEGREQLLYHANKYKGPSGSSPVASPAAPAGAVSPWHSAGSPAHPSPLAGGAHHHHPASPIGALPGSTAHGGPHPAAHFASAPAAPAPAYAGGVAPAGRFSTAPAGYAAPAAGAGGAAPGCAGTTHFAGAPAAGAAGAAWTDYGLRDGPATYSGAHGAAGAGRAQHAAPATYPGHGVHPAAAGGIAQPPQCLSDEARALARLGNHFAKKFCIVAVERMAAEAASVLYSILAPEPGRGVVPELMRSPLHEAGKRMLPNIRSLLCQLGRPKDEMSQESCRITLPCSVMAMDDGFSVHVRGEGGDEFACDGRTMKTFAAAAALYVTKGEVSGGAAAAVLPASKSRTTPQQDREAHCVAVAGPVLCVHDNQCRTQRARNPLLCVSIPGVNLAYSQSDKLAFVDESGRIRQNDLLRRMQQIWGLVLNIMAQQGVRFPVLCAIGCGEFKGAHYEVPELWATALALQLRQPHFNFAAVTVCCPGFGGASENFCVFGRVMQQHQAHLSCAVLIAENLSMVTVAEVLAAKGQRSAILNPSDPTAVRRGYVGMYWDGGHMALEEILALQTTLLLQHRGVNPELWEDRRRRLEVAVHVVEH